MTMSTPRDNQVVALFPGQGALSTGAGDSWRNDAAWDMVRAISEVVDIDVERLLLSADNDDVIRTDNAQIATYALSLVGWHSYTKVNPTPGVVMGHSLGEFTALVAAGVIDYVSGARLVRARGAAMRAANEARPGTMAALMGGDDHALRRLQEIDDLWIANFNGEGQTVVSGTLEAIDTLEREGKELGWRRVTRLNVGGAFHSPLMAQAQGELDSVLAATSFQETETRIVANVDGQIRNGGEQWRSLLSRQLTEPVQFLEGTRALPPQVDRSIEMPPGTVLTGLSKRIRTFASQGSAQPLGDLS